MRGDRQRDAGNAEERDAEQRGGQDRSNRAREQRRERDAHALQQERGQQ